MKKFISSLAFLCLLGAHVFAQAPPEGISYQAVALDPDGREIVGVDASGAAIPDRQISVRFSIIPGSPTADAEYVETHKTNTDAHGLFSLVIGSGQRTGGTSGSFASVNWGSGAHFLKVEIDLDGGESYVVMGTQQMMSVPYALYAKASGSGGGQGPKGEDGLSAYQLWLALGNTGTQADFIASLTGPAGAAGAQGPAGPQGPAGVAGANGADGVDGVAGPQGPAGPQGQGLTIVGSQPDAASLPVPYSGNTGDGYIVQNTGHLWIWDGSQWNDVGNISGPAGADGQSAYDIWLALGNTGTQTDFMNAITGPAGANGAQGAQGLQGPAGPSGSNGATGAQGPAGPQGIQGPAGPAGASGIGITWLGTFASAPASPTLNQAYYNSSLGSSFIWDGNSWEILAQDGTGGGSGGTLNDAYNGSGSGAGRIIAANNGAVEINASGATNNALRVVTAVPSSSAVYATHSAAGVAIRAESTSPSNTFSTIQAETNSSDANTSAIIGANSGAGYGVAAQLPATATGFAAVFGSNLRTTGGSGVDGQGFQGVSGQSFLSGGSGLFGIHNNPGLGADPNNNIVNAGLTSLGFYGALGQTEYRNGAGVFGFNADALGSLNDDASGVIGNGGFVGVLGTSQDPNGYGVASLTNIISLGNLEAVGVKTFVIDHPADPENKTLRHAAIESNEVLNVYRGNVVCDAYGNAIVQLPDYFSEINREFSYALTPIGAAAPSLHVSSEIQGNTFRISGGAAGQKISWQVTAERNDAWMQAHPFSAESMKPERKTGKRLLPQNGNSSAYFSTTFLKKPIRPTGFSKKPVKPLGLATGR